MAFLTPTRKSMGTMPLNARGTGVRQLINAVINLPGMLTSVMQAQESTDRDTYLYPEAIAGDAGNVIRDAIAYGFSSLGPTAIDRYAANRGILQLRQGQIAFTINPVGGKYSLGTIQAQSMDPSAVAVPVMTSLVGYMPSSDDPTLKALKKSNPADWEQLMCRMYEQAVQVRGIVGEVDSREDQNGKTVVVVDAVMSMNNTGLRPWHPGQLLKAVALPPDELKRTTSDPDVRDGTNPVFVPMPVLPEEHDLGNLTLWKKVCSEAFPKIVDATKIVATRDAGILSRTALGVTIATAAAEATPATQRKYLDALAIKHAEIKTIIANQPTTYGRTILETLYQMTGFSAATHVIGIAFGTHQDKARTPADTAFDAILTETKSEYLYQMGHQATHLDHFANILYYFSRPASGVYHTNIALPLTLINMVQAARNASAVHDNTVFARALTAASPGERAEVQLITNK